MALKKVSNFLGLFFFLGLLFLLYGIGYNFIDHQITIVNSLIAALGLLILFLSVYLLKRAKNSFKKRIYFKRFFLNIFVFTCLFTGLVLMNYLGFSYNQRFDLSQQKQHTLTPTTQDLLENLPANVRTTAFFVGIPPKYISDMFKEYERISNGRITTEIVDPIVQIGYASQFGNVISGKEKKVIVQAPGERRDIDFTDSSLTEEKLNNAILRVTRKARNAYFLMGHLEKKLYSQDPDGLNKFVKQLLANNVISRKAEIGLANNIPEDCDLLIVAGPKNNLLEEEIAIIQDYLKEGGNALFLVENTVVTTEDLPLSKEQMNKNPSLNNLLSEWGVEVAQDIVVDLASHAAGDVGSPATRNYMPHKAIVSGLDYTIFIRPRSISMLKDRRKTVHVAPLVLTSGAETSWGETNRFLKVKYDEGVDRPGPVPIAYVIWEPKEQDEVSDTRIIVVTDSDFLTNAIIDQYSNLQFGLNIVNWLTEVDYQVLVDKKEIKVHQLELTSKQKRKVIILLLMMPLLIAFLGIWGWLKQGSE